jgi:uncharacterized Zn finger protein
MGWYGGFAPYVPVAKRKLKAAKEVEKLKKRGQVCHPIVIEGQTIANTFWGKAWCKHLESYSDYANRLPRGRSYVRHGSVIDLKMKEGEITALVSGSSIYKVKIMMTKVITEKWNKIVNECAGKIDSLIELLQGKFSKAVMQIITDPKSGLFPDPREIKLSCSCPDWAEMCKHVAAVLYGVGARLDANPEELFILRKADHVELITKAGTTSLIQSSADQGDQILDESDLSTLFGIDISEVSQKMVNIEDRKLKGTAKKSVKIVKIKSARQSKMMVSKKSTKKKPFTNVKNSDKKFKLADKKTKAKNTKKADKKIARGNK